MHRRTGVIVPDRIMIILRLTHQRGHRVIGAKKALEILPDIAAVRSDQAIDVDAVPGGETARLRRNGRVANVGLAAPFTAPARP